MTPTPTPQPQTGDYVAHLLELAAAEKIKWAAVHGLPVPYMTDPGPRIVYVDGRLGYAPFYEAVETGMRALIGNVATVTRLHPGPSDHRSTG